MARCNSKVGDRYVEMPDEVKIGDDGSVMTSCWLDSSTICGGSCQAYDPMYASDETGKYTSCRIINTFLSIGSAITAFTLNFVKGTNDRTKGNIPGVNIEPPKVG